ncbi:MAG: hypothetical protein M1838_004712 [Thelocarpon superellum]|nr:MAG: hypothetical protein M1838_004712 [Thelocarpon superellum]
MSSTLSAAAAERDGKGRAQAFRFLDLPAELRNRIYRMHLVCDPVVLDLDPQNPRTIGPRLRLLRTCRQVHREASRVFYGDNTFRIFPLHRRFFNSKRPLLMRLNSRHRATIVCLELRVGPGWAKPPKSWALEASLGLHDMVSVRRLKIFCECDPSHPIFTGFRVGKDYYTSFCGLLVQQVIAQVPSIEEVQFDAYPSVSREGPLMTRLLYEAKVARKTITWGPLRGWEEVINIGHGVAPLGLDVKIHT